MIYLLLSILSSTVILVLFRSLERLSIKVFHVIILNYLAASALGFLLFEGSISFSEIANPNWIIAAAFIGTAFIAMFYIIGISTQKVGISVTTVSSKMSVVIPMLFSMLFFNEAISPMKYIGIFFAVLAVVLTVYKKQTKSVDWQFIYLPIIMFLGLGVIDSTVKYSEEVFRLTDNGIALFSAVSFSFAGIIGLVISLVKKVSVKSFLKPRVLASGILLGAANFGSMYFLIFALNYSDLDSSVVFGLNNVGIVAFSLLVALTVFKEKLLVINWVGILLCFVTLWFLMQV